MHTLFAHLYLMPCLKHASDDERRQRMRGVLDMQTTLHTGLLDYKDYIAIKTQRNVAITK